MNLQTWVVFLEFFGIGRAPEDMSIGQQQEPMSIERGTGGKPRSNEDDSLEYILLDEYRKTLSDSCATGAP